MTQRELKEKIDGLYGDLEDIETEIDTQLRRIRRTYDELGVISEMLDESLEVEDEGDDKREYSTIKVSDSSALMKQREDISFIVHRVQAEILILW